MHTNLGQRSANFLDYRATSGGQEGN